MLPNEDKERLALTLSTCLAIRIDSIDFQLSVSMVSKDNGPVYLHFLLSWEERSTLAFMAQMQRFERAYWDFMLNLYKDISSRR